MPLQKTNHAMSERALNQKYKIARMNLLLVIAFTAINILLLVTQSGTYFLFSASVPYLLTDLGMLFCGMYPPEVYQGELAGFEPFPAPVFYVLLAISIVLILIYLVAFLLSKKRAGWLIFALVFFALDTVAMFLYFGISLDIIIDIAFHIWVIVIFVQGIQAHGKLKELQNAPAPAAPTANEAETEAEESPNPLADVPDSPILRRADMEIKFRTLLAFDAHGHKVLYRRVKRVNELVIDGYVYAEYTALFEKTHDLTAIVDAHEFSVGFDGMGASYGVVDGEILAEKTRLF